MREALPGRKSGHGVKQTVAFFSLFHLHQLYTFVKTRKTSSYSTQFYKKKKKKKILFLFFFTQNIISGYIQNTAGQFFFFFYPREIEGEKKQHECESVLRCYCASLQAKMVIISHLKKKKFRCIKKVWVR